MKAIELISAIFPKSLFWGRTKRTGNRVREAYSDNGGKPAFCPHGDNFVPAPSGPGANMKTFGARQRTRAEMVKQLKRIK